MGQRPARCWLGVPRLQLGAKIGSVPQILASGERPWRGVGGGPHLRSFRGLGSSGSPAAEEPPCQPHRLLPSWGPAPFSALLSPSTWEAPRNRSAGNSPTLSLRLDATSEPEAEKWPRSSPCGCKARSAQWQVTLTSHICRCEGKPSPLCCAFQSTDTPCT